MVVMLVGIKRGIQYRHIWVEDREAREVWEVWVEEA